MKAVIIDDVPEIALLVELCLQRKIPSLDVTKVTKDFDSVYSSIIWADVDVVFVDHLLGTHNGLTVLKWIKANFPKVRAILLTGSTELEEEETGADLVLIKPVSVKDIQEAVYG